MEHAGSVIRLFRLIEANGGLSQVAMLSLLMAALIAVAIRFQALSRGLPGWREL